MTFEEILELTKNRIDETFEDEQIDIVIENAINYAYLFDLSKLDPTFKTTTVTIEDGKADLPSDLRTIEKIDAPLKDGEFRRRKGKTILSNNEGATFEVTYSVIPERLINPSDEPLISDDLQYLLSTKACEAYFQHRKKNSVAALFKTEYDEGKFEYSLLEDDTPEVIEDIHKWGEF